MEPYGTPWGGVQIVPPGGGVRIIPLRPTFGESLVISWERVRVTTKARWVPIFRNLGRSWAAFRTKLGRIKAAFRAP